MTRIEFIRSAGRWLMVMLGAATLGLLVASRKISLHHYCGADANCAGCGLNRICCPPDKKHETK